MKVIIAGSLFLTRIADVIDAVHAAEKVGIIPNEIVSGACSTGPDEIGEWLAKVFFDEKLPVKRFEPDWKRYGKSAEPIRNSQMACYGDALILIWDGKSHGSHDMLTRAKASGLKVYEHIIT